MEGKFLDSFFVLRTEDVATYVEPCTKTGKISKILGLLAEVCLNSSVYIQYLTVNKIRCGGGKEYCGACEVLGVTPSACGSLGFGNEYVEGML